jgi:hypothetical protein
MKKERRYMKPLSYYFAPKFIIKGGNYEKEKND